MEEVKRLIAPATDQDVLRLKAGNAVLISGPIYTARDEAHKKLVDLIKRGEELPIELNGQFIYYVGPAPAPPGKAVGSAGPTTSGRMDPYTPSMLARGMKACIGKGSRSEEVKKALQKYKAVYLAAVGGAGALLARSVIRSEVVAYAELGAEAIYRLEVRDFPATVINDAYGNDLYQEGIGAYRRM